MIAGKCPKCEKPVTRVNLHPIEASEPMGPKWKAVTYNCPSCNTVLTVQIDPVAIRTEIINGVVKALRGK